MERRFEVQKKAEISGDNTGRKREEGDGGGVAQGVWCAGSKTHFRVIEIVRWVEKKWLLEISF